MNDPSSQLYLGENPRPVPIPRVIERAYLWLVAALCGAALAAVLVFAVASRSRAEAERIAGPASYAGALVSAMAAAHGRRFP